MNKIHMIQLLNPCSDGMMIFVQYKNPDSGNQQKKASGDGGIAQNTWEQVWAYRDK